MREIQDILRRVRAEPGPWVLATLVSVEGSSYRRAGARALLGRDGSRTGSISGGCLEEDILLRASRVAAQQSAEVALYDTTAENDLVWGVGLGCHGIVRVLLEPLSAGAPWLGRVAEALAGGPPCCLRATWRAQPSRPLGTTVLEAPSPAGPGANEGVFDQRFEPPPSLFVYGAGDDAQPLVAMAAALGWQVTVADPRPQLATPERFPGACRVLTGRPERLVALSQFRADSLAVIMTHHYVHDLPLLRALLPQPLPYVGLLGPRQRAEKMLEALRAEGLWITDDMTARCFAPVGLDLGAEGPHEIALSIMAEMKATLAGRSGQSLRERLAPIHDDGR